MRIDQSIKARLPQLAVLSVNVAMITSYEYVSITGYIAVALMIVS